MKFRSSLAVVLLTFAAAAAAGSAAAVPAHASDPGYRDYLSHGPVSAQRTDDPTDPQCARPVAQRTGNWFCTDGAPAGLRGGKVNTLSTCSSGGCWSRNGGYAASFTGHGTYGYNAHPVGTVDLGFSTRNNGGQIIASPVHFDASTVTKSLHIEGDRLYYSASTPAGKPVQPSKYGFVELPGANAGAYRTWTPNGYKSYENTVAHTGVVIEWVWTHPEYPGNWYFYAKSIKADKNGSGSAVTYVYGADNYLGSSPIGSGYHAG